MNIINNVLEEDIITLSIGCLLKFVIFIWSTCFFTLQNDIL